MKSSGTILLVDRSEISLTFQETVLRRKDNRIVTARTGVDGLAKAREHKPRLVIFGFQLEDMTGPEFCREIRESDDIKQTSLLFVADNRDSEQVDLCMAAGCNDIIFRPLERHDFDSKVEKLLFVPVRKQVRTLTRVEVALEEGSQFILGHTVNLSSTGMLLRADHLLPGGATIKVHFYLPNDPAPLHLDSQIIRAEYNGAAPRYGLRFLSIGAPERERIDAFVIRLRSRESI